MIDDSGFMRDDIATTLRQHNFEPVDIILQNGSTDQIVSRVLDSAHLAVCDQRLNGMTGNTEGARIVAELIRRKVPAILYSERKKDDTPELRRYFDTIPCFLDRNELSESDLANRFASISRELDQGVSKERRAYRTLVRVEEIIGHQRAAVVIPAWHPDESLEISTDDIDKDIRDQVKSGTYLIANVNLHARTADSLFAKDFRIAKKPYAEDGLA